MRIVNIGLSGFLLLVALVPVVYGDFLRVPVLLAAGLASGLVFSVVAWFSAGRDDDAREAGFGIGMVLAIASIVTLLVREQLAIREPPPPINEVVVDTGGALAILRTPRSSPKNCLRHTLMRGSSRIPTRAGPTALPWR